MRLLAAILSAGLLAAGANGAATKNVRPFVYTFHVSSSTVEGVAQPVHGGGATVRIHLHSARLPKTEALRWRGAKDFSAGNGEAVAGVPLTGTMVFTDARRPGCNRTVKIAASGAEEVLTMELLYARDPAATPMIQFALANYPVEIDLRLGRQAPRCGYRR